MYYIEYSKLSKNFPEELKPDDIIVVLLNLEDKTSVLATLKVEKDLSVTRVETYKSLKEFSTISMKELLTLYAKRKTINSDPSYFSEDDPKLHAFLSKLSFSGIETICKHINEFPSQFKEGKITIKLPKLNNWRTK